MAAPKTINNLAGDTPKAAELATSHPSKQLNLNDVAAAILQLQNTVNALQAAFNTHTHSGVTAGAGTSGTVSTALTATAASAQNLFTTS